MLKIIFTTSLMFIHCLYSIGQTACDCADFNAYLIDSDSTDTNIRERPNGRILFQLKNDVEKEDYKILTIIGSEGNWLKLNSKNQRTNYVFANLTGGHTNNYSEDSHYCFYQFPDTDSKVILDFHDVLTVNLNSCSGNWVLVSTIFNNQKYTGWIEHDRICGNPYTNCN